MNEATLLQALRTSAKAKRIFESDFDFLPVAPEEKSHLIQLRGGVSHDLIARDKSGGEFGLCDSGSLQGRPVVYASSEGQAGIIARSLENALSIISDLPYWQDCLKFSGGGQLAEMRRVVPLSEGDLVARNPSIASNRQTLRAILGLSKLPDAVQELHSSVVELSPFYLPSGSDGSPFESLFGRFTVKSNAEWRRRLEDQT